MRPLKLIQVTDPHVLPAGDTLWGLEPRARLDAALAHVSAHHADADLCVITGDLAAHGEPASYGSLRDALAGLRVPWRLLLGNHDDRAAFRAAFPEAPDDGSGFVQGVLDTEAGRLLFLDTLEPGAAWGSYCERRLPWLRARLAEAAGRAVYVFLHHPPCAIGLPSLDRMPLRAEDAAALGEALVRHGGVRHLFCGHVHRPIAGSWRGMPLSAIRGTNHQVALDFATEAPVPKNHEPPAYAVVLIHPERTLVHMHDFLDEPPPLPQ